MRLNCQKDGEDEKDSPTLISGWVMQKVAGLTGVHIIAPSGLLIL